MIITFTNQYVAWAFYIVVILVVLSEAFWLYAAARLKYWTSRHKQEAAKTEIALRAYADAARKTKEDAENA